MKTLVPKMTLLLALLLACSCCAAAAGLTASPTSLTFSYVSGSGTVVKPQAVTVTLPSSMSGQTMAVTTNSVGGWLVASPLSGTSPLVLTVSANPTTLYPGSHSGSITIDTSLPSGYPAIVSVTFVISAAAPTLQVQCPTCDSTLTVSMPTYVTGGLAPSSFSVYVASSGDAIPFSVTAANSAAAKGTGTSKASVWLRVAQKPDLSDIAVTTSGVALSGSISQIYVSIDPTLLLTLDPISSPFVGTITFAPTKSGSSTGTSTTPIVVTVTLPVLPGDAGALNLCQPPDVRCIIISPNVLPAVVTGVSTDPAIVTILGDNFFAGTTSVAIGSDTDIPTNLTPPSLVWISRAIMQVTIPAASMKTPATLKLSVRNELGQQPVSASLTIVDPTLPSISSVVSAASYVSSLPDPLNLPDYPHVSPREIISIFGRNLGPPLVAVTPIADLNNDPANPISPKPLQIYPPGPPTGPLPIAVDFLVVNDPNSPYHAPIIMYSPTQINCVVPWEVANGIGSQVSVQVTNDVGAQASFSVTATPSHPGIFTSGGAGLGQAAVLNYNSSTSTYTVNSSGAAAPRSSAIVIYATGLGDLQPDVNTGALSDGFVVQTAIKLAAMNPDSQNPTARSNVNVMIDNQPAVVTYAGTTPGAVAGLIQINAIVPLAAKTGAAIPITVSIGDNNVTPIVAGRSSQSGVWLAVK